MKMTRNRALSRFVLSMAVFSLGVFLFESDLFAGEVRLSQGQTIYVPVYSYVLIGEKGHQFQLAINLSVRNTDLSQPILLLSVDYYSSDGQLLKGYLEQPLEVKPLAAKSFFLRTSDVSGGLSPSFIVRWKSVSRASEPIVEAAMIGDKSGQGISFTATGRVIKDAPD